ncbi:hypothetical protein [Psychroserpens luteus]|uniref:Uncharacterized protein n=1 Tax=Psychroserpens luteus TaxID=1434066 RepID=A0ABW5ZWD6_9FLAO|nr:hypothetical protein [Psychroserpens luteus]
MKLREKKRVIILLKQLSEFLETTDRPKLSIELFMHYTDDELRQIVYSRYYDEWSLKELKTMKRIELIKIIDCDFLIVLWTLNQLEEGIIKV